MLNRRGLIKLAGMGGATLALPTGWLAADRRPAPGTEAPFSRPLHVPPVARPTWRTANADYYDFTMAEHDVQLFPGVATKVQAYNGEFPGPIISARRGRPVIVRHRNHLAEPAVVHLHGGHVPSDSDGFPMDLIEPGGVREYLYPNKQLGATLWYHDHAHHVEAEHVYRGLAGLYLLDDEAEHAYGLPDGEYDVPIMLRDAQFDDSGQLVYTMEDFADRTTLLVNGRPRPHFQVAARKYRFRFVNSSNERAFGLTLADGATMQLIGSDGGLLPAPVPARTFDLWPGERVEVVIDFSRYPLGTQLLLNNTYGEVDGTKSVLRFDVVRRAQDRSRVPSILRPLPDLGTPTVNREVQFKLDLTTGMFTLDGKVFDPDRVDQQIKLKSTEIWTIRNADTRPAIPHNLHLHLVQYQVLDRNGVAVGGHETGLKDTVTVPAGGVVRIKVRFTDYTGKFVYHCHMLDHSSMGMMGRMDIAP